MNPREYVIVQSEAEATELLTKRGEKARIIAGGTGIYEVAHRGLFAEVEVLIDITRLNLNYVNVKERSLRIGSCATMTSIFEAVQLAGYPELGALLDALQAIQPLQVKNVATVGGAICTAIPFFDLPVSLIALGAEVLIAPDSRTVKLVDFIKGHFAVDLQAGEFVKEVNVPLLERSEAVGSAFQKFALTGDDWAIINCGSRVKIKEDGLISEARVCFGGGVGEKPKRADKIERALVGSSAADENSLKTLLDDNVEQDLDPISDLRASSKYRTHLAKVLARRSILRSAQLANGGNA